MRRFRNVFIQLTVILFISGIFFTGLSVHADPEEESEDRYIISILSEYTTVTDAAGNPVSSAVAGETLIITFNESKLSNIQSFTGWSTNMDGGFGNQTKLTVQMPSHDLMISAEYGEDPKKVASSESEAESIRESSSIEASEKESESISESESKAEEAKKASSIAASEYAAKTISVGSYEVYVHLTKTTAPDDFKIANDPDSFSEPVECFYSTKYKTYAYYAKKNEESNYCIYNKMTKDMMPFVTFNGAENICYLVIAPDSEIDLPEEVLNNTSLNLSTLTSSASMFVPAWTVIDSEDNQHTVIYLVSDQGEKDFFVYDNSNGSIKLTAWNVFKDDLTADETSEAEHSSEEPTRISDTESSSEASTYEAKTTDPEKKSAVKNYAIWLVIIGAIMVLLVIAIVVVFYMSKKQEEEEALLDEEEGDDPENTDSDDDEEYDSSYANNEAKEEDLSSFDFSFEDAFPEEVAPRGMNSQTQEQARSVGKNASEKSFEEELDEYLNETEDDVLYFNNRKK